MVRLILGLVVSLTLSAQSTKYPPAARGNVTDNFPGERVADAYRWMEDPDTPEARAWINAENALTDSFLSSGADIPALKKRLTELWSPVIYMRPPADTDQAGFARKRNRYFFYRRDPGRNQPILYWMNSRTDQPKPLLDPNTLSSEGTAAISSWSISEDGKLVAYGIARSGSDWQDIRFREVDSGKDRPDMLEWSKNSAPEWATDGSGVYYSRYPKPDEKDLLRSANYDHKLYFHKLGTAQSDDKLLYERPDHRDWRFYPRVTDDGRYLLIYVAEGTRVENLVFYRELKSESSKTTELISTFKGEYTFLGNQGATFYFKTTYEAPKGRVVAIDISKGAEHTPVIPEAENVLDQAVLEGSTLHLVYQKDVTSEVVVCGLDGKNRRAVPLPGIGTVYWATRSGGSDEQFFSYLTFTQPEMLYSLNTGSWKVAPFEKTQLPFDPNAFEVRQVFYPSKDGTKIPMFLIGKRGFKPDPSTPALLYGYGGFNISVTPTYSPLYLQWIELGGIVASANLRGGGEYGQAWHEAGMKLKKQNVFDDFIAAAEWLIANKYTSKEHLGIYGRSNGGLLVGAVLNQRPDLFGAAVPAVGVMDMLRFHKFTVGGGWTSDYGSPDNPVEYKAIRAYSPLHNVRDGGIYPPTLVLTSDHDDRVVPAHSFKYAAALQRAQEGPAPILIHIETSAGHGGGKPATKQVDEAATIIAFLQKTIGKKQ